jgi:coatomer protein complex subunit epsilon
VVVNSSLETADAQHPLLVDLAEKSELFDKAATKYKAKVAAA